MPMASSLLATWHPLRAPAYARRFPTRRLASRCALEERTLLESSNGSARGGVQLGVYLESGNGSGNRGLVKYERANGAAFESATRSAEAEELQRKKRIEEIGREDAWFKTQAAQQPQVASFFLPPSPFLSQFLQEAF